MSASVAITAVAVDAVVFEPNSPKLVELTLPTKRLPAAWDGLRIAQLSDFHYDEDFSVIPLRKAVDVINTLKPDLIVLTGDFVSTPFFASRRKKAAEMIDPCAQLLTKLKSKLGLYACLGNHDAFTDPDRIFNSLQSHNITVLKNRSIAMEKDGKRLWLAGVDDVINGAPDMDVTLQKIPQDEAVVLMAHEPDYATYVSKYPVDLQLSGHSHGGQVRLPFIGAPVLPDLGVKYPKGLYQVGKLTLYTNVGIGTVNLPVRFRLSAGDHSYHFEVC
ncbi:MAG TPA: metallophosphoesterase [Terriglobales bacterium]|nr:metallophosphoesterase [Terriglobales bacterium]